MCIKAGFHAGFFVAFVAKIVYTVNVIDAHHGGIMYRIMSPGVKIHLASDEAVAHKVMENLCARFQREARLDEIEKNSLFFDGNNVRIDKSEPIFVFQIGDIRLHVLSQHWFDFKRAVHKHIADTSRADNQYGGQFFKLHGSNCIICFTPEQREVLLALVAENAEDCDRKALKQWGHIDDYDAKDEDEGYLLTGTKFENVVYLKDYRK